jgi:hypothetical protein
MVRDYIKINGIPGTLDIKFIYQEFHILHILLVLGDNKGIREKHTETWLFLVRKLA